MRSRLITLLTLAIGLVILLVAALFAGFQSGFWG